MSSDRKTQLTKREIDTLNYWQTLISDANTKTLIESWQELFKDKESRHIYMDEFLNAYLGMQIKTLREQRSWTQTKLADLSDMKQTRISLLESMDYSAWSLDVLRRLAKAFDLRLVVKFEDFGSYLKDYFEFEQKFLERRSFDDDVVFGENAAKISDDKPKPSEPAKETIGKFLESLYELEADIFTPSDEELPTFDFENADTSEDTHSFVLN